MRIVVDLVALEHVFLRVLVFSPASHYSTVAPKLRHQPTKAAIAQTMKHSITLDPYLGGLNSGPELAWRTSKRTSVLATATSLSIDKFFVYCHYYMIFFGAYLQTKVGHNY
jgi:hypothetical protein